MWRGCSPSAAMETPAIADAVRAIAVRSARALDPTFIRSTSVSISQRQVEEHGVRRLVAALVEELFIAAARDEDGAGRTEDDVVREEGPIDQACRDVPSDLAADALLLTQDLEGLDRVPGEPGDVRDQP